MSLKEKIAQIYLTFIFIFLGYSRKLVLIPFILDIKIKNQFLLDTIGLLFEPVNLMLTPLGYIVAVSGPMMIFFGLLVFIIGFFLFVIESFLLSKIIIFIFKKIVPENFFERFYFVVKKKISGDYPNSFNAEGKNSDKFQKIKYYFPVLIFVLLLAILYPAISSLTDNRKEDKEKQRENYTNYNELDSDKDGLPDYIEKILGTDINNSDSDGDGYTDFDEIKNGYNPLSDKKYTQEEWKAVKEKIKNEDNGFYKNNFIVDKIKILPPGECNLPDKIGDYILKDSQYFVIKPENVKFYPKGAVSKTAISYTAPPYIYSKVLGSGRLYEIPYFETEITITNFDSSITNIIEEENTWSLLALSNVGVSIGSGRFLKCKIENIKGLCSLVGKVYATGKKTYEAAATFLWHDNNMLKVIELRGGKADEDFSEKERKALDDLILFAPVIKNCKIENK